MVLVHGQHARSGVAEERPVDEAEAESGRQVVSERAALHVEDLCVDAATVQAEDAREVEGWVFG